MERRKAKAYICQTREATTRKTGIAPEFGKTDLEDPKLSGYEFRNELGTSTSDIRRNAEEGQLLYVCK